MDTSHYLTGSVAVIAWIFIIIGILAICFALFFLLIIRYSFFKGLGMVFLATAMCQMAYGCYLLHLSHDPYTSGSGNFTWISFGIMFCGGFLLRWSQTFWKGVGLGMLIQGGLSLVLLLLHAGELEKYRANMTQQRAEQTECRKKVDEGRNW